jgi:D-alanyl-D-alanine carboxypeptidase
MAVFSREARTPRRAGRASRTSAWLSQVLLTCAALTALLPTAAKAQVGSYRYSSIVVDNDTGRVTEAANADAPRYPASLTKLMTLYVTFEALRDHKITLDQRVPVSVHAAEMEPVKLGLLPGNRLTVEEAILAIITKSANDAACALGELVGGDEDRFAQIMTLRARSLGMTHTTFRNASGLPDPDQVTTARDLALLAHHLITDFPQQYHYFSVPSFEYRGRTIWNHDRMLVDYDGADGLKTGYTKLSGHNLVTSAQRGNVRLIGVVMGAASNPERDMHMASLLDSGFTALGVPVEPNARPHFRLPPLIASAEAAPLRPRYASVRVHGHLFHRRLVHEASHRVGAAPPHATYAVAHGRTLAASAHARMLAGCHAHHHCAVVAHSGKRHT